MIEFFELQPIDTLFFRDARPMRAGAGSGGHGANWPLPTVIHEALRTALLRTSGLMPDQTPAAGDHRESGRKFATSAFESLRTLGPLPIRNGEVYFPTPADIIPDPGTACSVMAPVLSPAGSCNMPMPWLKPVASRWRPTKAERCRWVTQGFLNKYLGSGNGLVSPEKESLFFSENRIGIGIDRATWSAADGKLFVSEHLRLAEGVRLAIAASLSHRDAAFGSTQVRLSDLCNSCITLGGESRMCRVLSAQYGWAVDPPKSIGSRIKWVLATPAVFRGGWLPNWVDPGSGAVLLRSGETERLPDEDRKAWRERVRALRPIAAKMIAARIDKPVCFSGWDLNLAAEGENGIPTRGGPKPTLLAVPAGSVYYFEAQTSGDAEALIAALHGRTRSDFFGEKGMGWGFCGTWEPLSIEQ